MSDAPGKKDVLGHSRIFTPEVINDIHIKADLGRYRMRGFSIFKPMPHWDELVFLPGTYATCPTCHGSRYNPQTLEVTWHGRSVAQVLALTVREAVGFFAGDRRISRALVALDAIGLGYLTLGQPATELSGGEAQRIKLATELQRSPRGHTVYLLDEPTTGLHPADVARSGTATGRALADTCST